MPSKPAPTQLVSLRIPAALHELLRTTAEQNDRSMNTEMAMRLAQSFKAPPHLATTLDAIELPPAVRLRHTTAAAAVDHLIQMIDLFDIERVVLAARTDPLEERVLVVLLQTASHTILVDRTRLTLTRAPRAEEVKRLFHALERAGLLATAEYCPTLLPANAVDGSAETVAAHLLGEGKPQRWKRVGELLHLLSPLTELDEREFDRTAAPPKRRAVEKESGRQRGLAGIRAKNTNSSPKTLFAK